MRKSFIVYKGRNLIKSLGLRVNLNYGTAPFLYFYPRSYCRSNSEASP